MTIPASAIEVRALSCGPFRVREIAYGAGFRQTVHAHATTSVSLVLTGAVRERASAREEYGSALSVVVKPTGVMHSDEIGPRGALLLQLAFDEQAARGLMADRVDLGRWRWLHGQPAAAAMLWVLRAARAPGALRHATLEDRILDALAVLAGPWPAAQRGEPPRWLRTAKEALDDDIPGDRPVRELAHAVGAHPVSLSRAFVRHFGCSITEYRRRERLRRAAAAIEGSGHDISRIAHDAGFADHPHLCRAFRDIVGMSPSHFRDLTRGA